MLFNSLEYFLFLPAVWLIYFSLGQRFRWLLLLVASFWFYAALNETHLLLILGLVSISSYGFGLCIEKVTRPQKKKELFWCGIVTNLSILVLTKYLPFLSDNLYALLSLFFSELQAPFTSVISVIGVSYYIFQSTSYLIEIYLGTHKAETHLGYFILSLAFFPKLLQGPIERSDALIAQLRIPYEFNYANMRFGVLLIAWGLAKKVILSDRLGFYVDGIYGNIAASSGLPLLLATYAYSFQIYFDFSAYTDMALGAALLFNVKLTQNFNRPYLASSVIDFWRRWHISFSQWILAYIFKPLQLKWRYHRQWGTAAALLITFVISGAWHGAAWHYIVWGLIHGLMMAISVISASYRRALSKNLGLERFALFKVWKIFVTFNLISLTWIFFRSNDIHAAIEVFHKICKSIVGVTFNSDMQYVATVMEQGQALSLTIVVVGAFVVFYREASERLSSFAYSFWLRWSLYIAMTVSIISFWEVKYSQYIYFKF